MTKDEFWERAKFKAQLYAERALKDGNDYELSYRAYLAGAHMGWRLRTPTKESEGG